VVTPFKLGATLALLGLLALLVATDDQRGYIHVIDDANLLFHEAGHPLYGIFGETAELYGGTLGQLTFPLVAVGVFWWRRQAVSLVFASAWLFENFFNIARYLADARAQELPLLGGGEHDWEHILTRWGALESDTAIARVVRVIAWIGMLAPVAWVAWRFRRDRGRPVPLDEV